MGRAIISLSPQECNMKAKLSPLAARHLSGGRDTGLPAVNGPVKSLASNVDIEIQRVNSQISDVEEEIKKVSDEIEAVAIEIKTERQKASPDNAAIRYLSDKKKRLSDEKKQLRREKEQLRDEEKIFLEAAMTSTAGTVHGIIIDCTWRRRRRSFLVMARPIPHPSAIFNCTLPPYRLNTEIPA